MIDYPATDWNLFTLALWYFRRPLAKYSKGRLTFLILLSESPDTPDTSSGADTYINIQENEETVGVADPDPDPGYGIQCFFDPGSGKNPDPRYGINIPDHISKSLVTNF